MLLLLWLLLLLRVEVSARSPRHRPVDGALVPGWRRRGVPVGRGLLRQGVAATHVSSGGTRIPVGATPEGVV